MQTIKSFIEGMEAALHRAMNQGQTLLANEIAANVFTGVILLSMVAITLGCWGLNEIGVFTASKTAMRIAAILSLLIMIPISVVNGHYHGDKRGIRSPMIASIICVSGIVLSLLGHNVTLVMVIPVLLSIRYHDMKFTTLTALFGGLVSLIACVLCALFGTLNLNIVQLEAGTTIDIVTTLRDAIIACGIDQLSYIKLSLLNDYIPRLLVYILFSVVATQIAKHGRVLMDVQEQISERQSRVETELNLATQIQTGMLPCIFPAFPSHFYLDLFALNRPAREVGGDFYDYFIIDDDHVGIVIADVSGKGVGAALFMTISKIVIKNQLQAGLSPAEAMMKSNAQLCENNEAGLFVTVWAAVYEVPTRKLTYTNAGHNFPVIIKANGAGEFLKGKNGFVLAGMDTIKYSQNEIQLEVGDEIILYTDGVTEATNGSNELFGDERLLMSAGNAIDKDIEGQLESILSDIDAFVGDAEQFDDITMMAIKVTK